MAEPTRLPPDPDALERALAADGGRLTEALAHANATLSRHASGVALDGLISDSVRVNRPSLGRQEDRLRLRVYGLRDRTADLHRRAAGGQADDPALRDEVRRLAGELRGLRDAEAGIALDGKNTDLGSGE
jgi:hypothetical protein